MLPHLLLCFSKYPNLTVFLITALPVYWNRPSCVHCADRSSTELGKDGSTGLVNFFKIANIVSAHFGVDLKAQFLWRSQPMQWTQGV